MDTTKDSDNWIVFQSNQLVRYIRHDMSMQQKNIYLFLASMIRKNDDPDTVYSFPASYMARELNMTDGGKNFKDLKAILKYLRDHSQWIRNEKGNLEVVSILSDVEFNKETEEFEIRFHRLIQPHLFNLVERFTAVPLEFVKCLKCKYSIELYEFLLSYFNEKGQEPNDFEFSLEEIRERLNCDLERWVDIKRFALDKAIEEIKEYSTAMRVSYTAKKEGKRVTRIVFHLTPAEEYEQDSALENVRRFKRANKPKNRKRISKTKNQRREPDMTGLPV